MLCMRAEATVINTSRESDACLKRTFRITAQALEDWNLNARIENLPFFGGLMTRCSLDDVDIRKKSSVLHRKDYSRVAPHRLVRFRP